MSNDELDGTLARAIDAYHADHPDLTVREIMQGLWRLNGLLQRALACSSEPSRAGSNAIRALKEKP